MYPSIQWPLATQFYRNADVVGWTSLTLFDVNQLLDIFYWSQHFFLHQSFLLTKAFIYASIGRKKQIHSLVRDEGTNRLKHLSTIAANNFIAENTHLLGKGSITVPMPDLLFRWFRLRSFAYVKLAIDLATFL